MTVFASDLNEDQNGVKTSSQYADRGDGTPDWYMFSRVADGGNATEGAKADAAVTDPASSGSIVALLKGILGFVRNSATGLLKSEDAAHSSGDAGVMALAVRNDSLASRVGTDGDYTPLAVDAAGAAFSHAALPLVSSSTSPLNSTSVTLETSRVIKTAPGVLLGITGYNNSVAEQFIQLHNATSLPADTAIPVIVIVVPAKTNFSLDLGVYGRYFSTGIVACNSSTAATKTIGSADCWFDAQYV